MLARADVHKPETLIVEAVDVVIYVERYDDEQGQTKRRVCTVALLADELDASGNYVLSHCKHPSLLSKTK